MADSSPAVQDALALIQKTNATGGGSLHEHLVKLLIKVGGAEPRKKGRVRQNSSSRCTKHCCISAVPLTATGAVREALRPCGCTRNSAAGQEGELQCGRQRQGRCRGATAGELLLWCCMGPWLCLQQLSNHSNTIVFCCAASCPRSQGSGSSKALRVRSGSLCVELASSTAFRHDVLNSLLGTAAVQQTTHTGCEC